MITKQEAKQDPTVYTPEYDLSGVITGHINDFYVKHGTFEKTQLIQIIVNDGHPIGLFTSRFPEEIFLNKQDCLKYIKELKESNKQSLSLMGC